MKKISYDELNSKQKENYNFHKIAAVLAEYGYTSIRLTDDWQGADFIAQHIDGETFLKVQLKGRMSIAKKYIGKNLHIGFPYEGSWYLFPHDEVAEHLQTTLLSWGDAELEEAIIDKRGRGRPRKTLK